MKKYLYFIFVWVFALSLTSCEDDDQYSIESVIIDVRVTGNQLRGTFFLTSDSRGFNFILGME